MREETHKIYGKRVSLKKVSRLMRENGLNARRRRKYILYMPEVKRRHRIGRSLLTLTV
jgi:transposase InsO family protein